jgi:hypothetical protein
MDPRVRNNKARFSSGTTICIENTIKVHVFPSQSANWEIKTHRFTSQEAGQRRKHSVRDEKCPTDQWGNKSLMGRDGALCTLEFSENSESLRKFGGRRLGLKPKFLMRDQVDRRHE